MRRRLVTTNEAARHPLRKRLVVSEVLIPRPSSSQKHLQTIREFLLSFTACFLAALAFIG